MRIARRNALVLAALLVALGGCGKDEPAETKATYDNSTPAKLYSALHQAFNADDVDGIWDLSSKATQDGMTADFTRRLNRIKDNPEALERFKKRMMIQGDPLSMPPKDVLVASARARLKSNADETRAAFIWEFGQKYLGTGSAGDITFILAEGPSRRRMTDETKIRKRRIEIAVVEEEDGWKFDEDKTRELKRKPTREIKTDADPLASLAFSADGKILAQCTASGLCKFWDAKNGTLLRQSDANIADVAMPAVFSADLRLVAMARPDKELIIWDTSAGKVIYQMGSPEEMYHPRAFSPDGNFLLATSSKGPPGTLIVWDTGTWRQLLRFQAHEKEIETVAFSPDGKQMVSACADKLIKIWDCPTWKMRTTLAGHTARITDLAFSADGRRLASVANEWTDEGENNSLIVWDTSSGSQLHKIDEYEAAFRVAFAPDSDRIILFGPYAAAIIDPASGTELREIIIQQPKSSSRIDSVVCSGDGEFIAAAGMIPLGDEKTAIVRDDRPTNGLILIWKLERTLQ